MAIEPCNRLFFRLCGLIVSVSEVYGSADSHQGHGSHDNHEAFHWLILLFGGYENSENKHQDGQKGRNHNHARRDVLVRKEHRSAQGGQEISGRFRRYFLTSKALRCWLAPIGPFIISATEIIDSTAEASPVSIISNINLESGSGPCWARCSIIRSFS